MKTDITYLFLILLTVLFIFQGCKNASGNNKTFRNQSLEECVNAELPSQRALKKISKEINAEQKTFSLDTFFQKRVNNGFNGAILVEQKGVLLCRNIQGLSNLQTKDSLNFSSTFQLASVSKMFTGVAVLQLVDEGKINLNDTIQKFIPQFPYKGITIANLLSHRSGLPNYLYSFENKRKQKATPPDDAGLVNWFINANPQIKPSALVNRKFQYNNTNYAVLARIVEIVTGKSFPNYMREKLFLPLGMNSTYIDTYGPDSLLATKTTGYDGTLERQRDFYDGVYGDKGVFSTVDDMLKWYHGLRSGCLLKPTTLDSAFVPRSLEKPSRHNYGCGFRLMTNVHDMTQVHYVYHGGWWNGYSNMFWMDYDDDYVIIMLSNKRNRISYDVEPVIQILENGAALDYDRR